MSYQSYSRGKLAENSAAEFISQQGWTIIERNYRSRFGEIDIIAVDGKTLVFVEVRMRKMEDQVHPLETISRGKQNRLIKTAQMYLTKNNPDCFQCRFDVLSIKEDNGQQEIEIFRNMIEG